LRIVSLHLVGLRPVAMATRKFRRRWRMREECRRGPRLRGAAGENSWGARTGVPATATGIQPRDRERRPTGKPCHHWRAATQIPRPRNLLRRCRSFKVRAGRKGAGPTGGDRDNRPPNRSSTSGECPDRMKGPRQHENPSSAPEYQSAIPRVYANLPAHNLRALPRLRTCQSRRPPSALLRVDLGHQDRAEREFPGVAFSVRPRR
jgi:hypothetical protein